jgi:hypothetical protein
MDEDSEWMMHIESMLSEFLNEHIVTTEKNGWILNQVLATYQKDINQLNQVFW